MSNQFKPTLAGTVESTDTLNYPLLASPKLDGIRAIVIDGVVVSRSLKPIPNKYVQSLFGNSEYEGLDGELICGDPTAPDCYRQTNSAVMSIEGEPDVAFFVFDEITDSTHTFVSRFQQVEERVKNLANAYRVKQLLIHTPEELSAFEETTLDKGFEGVMLRNPDGYYKYGRSTLKEGLLLKLKRFVDDEAEVVGFEELMSNQNEATTDALGHTERSTHQENLVPMGTLGALICKTKEGVEFNIGTGFDAKTRAEIWANRETYKSAFAKFKHFLIGAKDKPRFPVFLGFRALEDM